MYHFNHVMMIDVPQFDADVMAGNSANGTEIVAAVDTWNNHTMRNNIRDAILDVSLFNGSLTNEGYHARE